MSSVWLRHLKILTVSWFIMGLTFLYIGLTYTNAFSFGLGVGFLGAAIIVLPKIRR
jgi:hypothetical protein